MFEVGSMEVVGVYKDAGLFAGLQEIVERLKENTEQTVSLQEETEHVRTLYEEAVAVAQNFGGLQFGGLVDELEDVENKTKNVKTSFVRLTAVAVFLGNAATKVASSFLNMLKNAIGSSPYLIGALTRIKTDIMLMGWALTKHLKPAFDLLADAIHALRKGDWDFFKTKAKEAWDYFIEVVKGAWSWIKEHGPEWLSNIMQTLENMANRIINFDWSGKGLWEGFRNVIITVWDEVIDPLLPEWLSDLISALGTWIDSHASLMRTTWLKLTKDIPWGKMGSDAAKEFWDGVKEYLYGKEYILSRTTSGTLSMDMDYLKDIEIISPIEAATGKFIAADGPIYVHAGEEIIPANSNRQTNQNPETNIILDFAGAAINLASGIDLDDFAGVVSQKIADQQSWRAY